jgi:hypothetical protein
LGALGDCLGRLAPEPALSEVQGRAEGDRAIAGEGKNGGKKRREGEKKGGRVGGGAGQLAIFKTAFSNVWHSAPR